MAVFADTFFWIALTNPEDLAHKKAISLIRTARPGSVVTTEYVLTEYLNYFSPWGPTLRTAGQPKMSIKCWQTRQYMYCVRAGTRSWADWISTARPDKGYSLTDCISMQVMQQSGLTEVLTNDRHFDQEGFRALFRDPDA